MDGLPRTVIIRFYDTDTSSVPSQPQQMNDGGDGSSIFEKGKKHIVDLGGEVKDHVKEKAGSTGKKIGEVIDPDLYHDKIEISLKHKSYKNISVDEAAKMLGYFTQKMQNAGFPWGVYEVKGDNLKKREQISEMEALRRLQNGQEILLQPMRNLQLDISADSLSAVSKMGGDPLKKVDDVATLSKNTKVAAANEGIEVRFGEPVEVKGFGELKLLYQMYNPDEKIEEKNDLGKAAHELSFFTKKTLGTNYPWRFVKESNGSKFIRSVRTAFSKALPGAVVGAGIGLMIGGPIGLLTGAWATTATLVSYGAAIGGGLMAADGARSAQKGVDINAFETLGRVLDKKPVIFQERRSHTVTLPILGNFTWYTDHGKGSVISSPSELELFNKMQDQA
ncbi:MAG: hypothetical protein AB9903_21115 [Vulcanimicrobiota bacterium]